MLIHPIVEDVERFLKLRGMSDSAFGRSAVNDWKLVRDLRAGRRIWPETEQKVRAFMASHSTPIEQNEAADAFMKNEQVSA